MEERSHGVKRKVQKDTDTLLLETFGSGTNTQNSSASVFLFPFHFTFLPFFCFSFFFNCLTLPGGVSS